MITLTTEHHKFYEIQLTTGWASTSYLTDLIDAYTYKCLGGTGEGIDAGAELALIVSQVHPEELREEIFSHSHPDLQVAYHDLPDDVDVFRAYSTDGGQGLDGISWTTNIAETQLAYFDCLDKYGSATTSMGTIKKSDISLLLPTCCSELLLNPTDIVMIAVEPQRQSCQQL